MLAPATVPAKNPNQNVKITSLKTSKKRAKRFKFRYTAGKA